MQNYRAGILEYQSLLEAPSSRHRVDSSSTLLKYGASSVSLRQLKEQDQALIAARAKLIVDSHPALSIDTPAAELA